MFVVTSGSGITIFGQRAPPWFPLLQEVCIQGPATSFRPEPGDTPHEIVPERGP